MISVTPEAGDRFSITVRDHVLHTDQPVEDGGEDTAPTPVELFIASLASCVAHYARGYLVRHDLPTEGLRVDASWETVKKPSRVGSIDVSLTLPEGVPEELRARLLAVASHCTVHNSITQPPDIRVVLA
ncbi:MAG: OsmC family protein [Actinomycetota bacterium]|nr:OsmC family protein [Actinomycetota bacterium]